MKAGEVWRWDKSCLVHLNHWFWAEESLLLFFMIGGKTLLRIDKLYIYIYIYIYMRSSAIYGRASFKRNGLILSCPMDLLLSIIVIYLPTSRTVIGGII